MGGPSPWGVSSLSHNLGIPVLGSYMEELGCFTCWEIHQDRKKGCRSLGSTCEKYVHVSLLTIKADRPFTGGWCLVTLVNLKR